MIVNLTAKSMFVTDPHPNAPRYPDGTRRKQTIPSGWVMQDNGMVRQLSLVELMMWFQNARSDRVGSILP